MNKSTDTTANWTDKQWAAYRLLTSRPVIVPTRSASFSNGTPKGGWTAEDKIK